MTSERAQRRIERLLDEADQAADREDWAVVRATAGNILAFDPENRDALAYLAAADRKLGTPSDVGQAPSGSAGVSPAGGEGGGGSLSPVEGKGGPTSFVGGRYQVKRFLGEGGKKRVYLAHDTLLDRDVAFALIKTEGLDAEGRERIVREAQAMGKLGTHPHIVSVFDMGQDGESPYLVTELMGGGDVEGLLQNAEDHRLPIERAVELAVQVCRGLEFAHEKGLVHRDLKPGNVWLTAEGTAKIGDFGLAVSLDRSRLTRAGMMVGTVAYMPPEQAMGGEVTPRSDLYSLGGMLYEMVCGRPPFVGEESVAIITQHLNTPPVSLMWHRPDCPPGLEALVLRLLEKDAAKRLESAREVREALALVGANAPGPSTTATAGGTPALPDNPLYRRTFVGREQELRQLQGAFDAAVSGQGALVMVVGEPGIGKTALCEQLATYAAMRGGKALVGHCYEEGSVSLPYLPFVEAIRSYVLTREPESLRSELGSAATEVARIVSEVRERVAVEPRESGDAEDDRWRLYQAVTTFLRNAAAVNPLLIVLEDLHWADRGSLDYLVHLARNLKGTRILILATYRDVEVDRSHPLSGTIAELRRVETFGRVLLRGLTSDEVHRMLNNLSGREVRWSLAEAVHRQTEGHPLFIQEVLRYLVEEGQFDRTGEAPGRRGSEELGIPEGLRDVIGKRLSRLSPECNRVLAVAAVAGRDFRLDVVQQVAGLPEEEAVAVLEEAKRAAVLEEHGTAGGAIQFRFAHAFFRQTLYEELFAPRRVRLHQQVGQALEKVYARRLDEHAAELAEHFAQSSQPDDLEKALRYSEMAARRALDVYAYREGVQQLERALAIHEVLDTDDRAKRCDLLLSLGEALMPAGDAARAEEHAAEAAFTLAEALGDQARASHACRIALEALRRYGGAGSIAQPEHERWAERATRYALPGTLDAVYARMADSDVLSFGMGRYQQSRAGLWETLDLARQLDHPQGLFAVAGHLLQIPPPEEWEKVFQLAGEASDWLADGVGMQELGQVLHHGGSILLGCGDRAGASALGQRLVGLAQRTRDPSLARRVLENEGVDAILDGRLEDGLEIAARMQTWVNETGNIFGQVGVADISAWCLLRLGRAEETLANLDGLTWDGVQRSPRRALPLAWAGRHEEARGVIRDRLEHAVAAIWLAELLEAALLLEDADLVASLARSLEPAAPVIVVPRAMRSVARLLGGAAALAGDAGRARGYYQQALDVCHKARFRPEIALTRLQLAELLLEHYPPEKAEALEHLDFAIAEFQEMKMQPSLQRALKHKGLLHA